MKILCFTDNLGSGGAQRQITLLARLLKLRGHEVTMAVYASGDFFKGVLDREAIRTVHLFSRSKVGRVFSLARLIHELHPNVVIAFQEMPSFIAEIATRFVKVDTLIISERQAVPLSLLSFKNKIIKHAHQFADVITTNSHANRDLLIQLHPGLSEKIHVIYNAFDFSVVDDASSLKVSSSRIKCRFVILASHKPSKNFAIVAHACKVLTDLGMNDLFEVVWYGDEAPGFFAKDKQLSEQLGVTECLILMNPVSNVISVLLDSDALIHPSFWEGLPNAVCEAMSVGVPVIISDVCDSRYLVEDEIMGYQFDPNNVDSLVHAMIRFMKLDSIQREVMRNAINLRARALFDPDVFCTAYENILRG